MKFQIVFNQKNTNGYFIKRSDFLHGRKLRYGETGNMYIVRLGKKNEEKNIEECIRGVDFCDEIIIIR